MTDHLLSQLTSNSWTAIILGALAVIIGLLWAEWEIRKGAKKGNNK